MSRYSYLFSSWKCDEIVIVILNVSNHLPSCKITKLREKLLHYKKNLIVKSKMKYFSRRETTYAFL